MHLEIIQIRLQLAEILYFALLSPVWKLGEEWKGQLKTECSFWPKTVASTKHDK